MNNQSDELRHVPQSNAQRRSHRTSFTFKHVLRRMHLVMCQRYHHIAFAWLTFALLFSMLNYEYHVKQRDLLFWRAQLEYCMDNSLLLPLVVLIITVILKLIIFALVIVTHFYPWPFLRTLYDNHKKHRYASFIVRRLIAQLEQALLKCPSHLDLSTSQDYCSAMEEAYDAIDLFRRDADKFFWAWQLLRHSSADDVFFILDEEEAQLRNAGYCSIDVKVNEHFLLELCKPELCAKNCGKYKVC